MATLDQELNALCDLLNKRFSTGSCIVINKKEHKNVYAYSRPQWSVTGDAGGDKMIAFAPSTGVILVMSGFMIIEEHEDANDHVSFIGLATTETGEPFVGWFDIDKVTDLKGV